ncbi:MAG: cohesin domain-containing protein [Porcipelethomonas sp.]
MKAKKILAGACASLMLAVAAVPAVSAAETVGVTIGNDKVKAGESFSVTLDLTDIPAAGINACDFGIKYDSSVITVTGVTAGALAKEDQTALEGVSALETNIESGLVSVIYGLGTTDSSYYMTGSGTFLTIEGTVSNTAEPGTKSDLELVAIDRLEKPSGTAVNSEIIFANLADDNTTYTTYTPTITNGWIEVEAGEVEPTTEPATVPSVSMGEVTLRGDIDCDGKIATADITKGAKYVASKALYPVTPNGLANGDLNESGDLDNVDVAKLIEYCLGKVTTL